MHKANQLVCGIYTKTLPTFQTRVHTVMKSHEKSWNFKMHFSGLEKSWNLGKMAKVMEKSWNFIFWPKYIALFETRNILLVMGQKYAQKRLGFQHFLVMENLNWSWKIMEKSLNFIAQFLCEPCKRVVTMICRQVLFQKDSSTRNNKFKL